MLFYDYCILQIQNNKYTIRICYVSIELMVFTFHKRSLDEYFWRKKIYSMLKL